MAHSRKSLVRKLKSLLNSEFPPPATIKLEDHDGVIGVITSERFSGMDSLDRQNWIGEIIDAQLSPEERRQIQVIVGVTADEGTGYLASAAPVGSAGTH
jgi:hypothetical protein